MSSAVMICLKSANNNKYLRFRHEEIQTYSLLKFDAEKVTDPYAQFEVVNSKNYSDLIHLKCRYNNKYLVRWSPNHHWISASAYEADENQNKWTCTLFKRIVINDGRSQKIRLLHVQLGHYARLLPYSDPFGSCLFAHKNTIDVESSLDVFTVVNSSLVSTMPRHVTFKGDNHNYLGPVVKDGLQCLQFSYVNPNDPKVAHEMFTNADGTVCIKSNYYGKFWRMGEGDWILADANDPRGSNNAEAMFRPTILGIDTFALLNVGSKEMYCKRFTDVGFENCLAVKTKDVDTWSKLVVTDLGASP